MSRGSGGAGGGWAVGWRRGPRGSWPAGRATWVVGGSWGGGWGTCRGGSGRGGVGAADGGGTIEPVRCTTGWGNTGGA
ncbi:hypothetical protein HGQ98_17610 [Achromobacter ruhlandii]|uniref:Uncharacterized protein n=1 Tax=Achromobacter ruhlandii TaxID=72557 RepID=A0A848NKW5_9BURK|nr:hypothetical protein [Achromobacter ruhlandii]